MNSVDHITVPILPMLPNAREGQWPSLAIYVVGQYKQHCLYFSPQPKGHGSLRPILMGTTTGVRYVVPESGHEGYEQQIGPWWLALAGVHC